MKVHEYKHPFRLTKFQKYCERWVGDDNFLQRAMSVLLRTIKDSMGELAALIVVKKAIINCFPIEDQQELIMNLILTLPEREKYELRSKIAKVHAKERSDRNMKRIVEKWHDDDRIDTEPAD